MLKNNTENPEVAEKKFADFLASEMKKLNPPTGETDGSRWHDKLTIKEKAAY
jgi:hypothetical protein